jgi:hypothetical protein
MLFIFSTPELIRNLGQLKTAVFLHWCLIRAVPLTNVYLHIGILFTVKKTLDRYLLLSCFVAELYINNLQFADNTIFKYFEIYFGGDLAPSSQKQYPYGEPHLASKDETEK